MMLVSEITAVDCEKHMEHTKMYTCLLAVYTDFLHKLQDLLEQHNN